VPVTDHLADLLELCFPTLGLVASRGELAVPFARTSKMQRHAFSVVGPTPWNDLLLDLCVHLATDSAEVCRYLFQAS